MGADTADDAGEGEYFPYEVKGFKKFSFSDEPHIVPRVEIDGTKVHAGGDFPVDHIGRRNGLGKIDKGGASFR